MNSRQRVLAALDHREPDRIPFDLGSTQVTGIHAVAYRNLREALGLPAVKIEICDAVQQLAMLDDDLIEQLGIDTRGLYPLNSHNWRVVEKDEGQNWAYTDEWGITHHRPKENGLYFSIAKVPLPLEEFSVRDIDNHTWPDVGNRERLAGLRQLAGRYRAAGYAVVLKDAFAGVFEFAQRIVGMQNLLLMMAADEKPACALFDKLLELKLAYWQTALSELGDRVDILAYADDYGTQESQLISPVMFRRLLKPRIKVIFDTFAALAPRARRFLHSCGNIRPLIPDFIDIGVDILNPVQITAAGMEPVALKRDFGQDVSFWGGGVDTQGVLPTGSPKEVREAVKRNIDALAPGGGYVFNTVHNIQPDVPPENIIAMWEALREYGA